MRIRVATFLLGMLFSFAAYAASPNPSPPRTTTIKQTTGSTVQTFTVDGTKGFHVQPTPDMKITVIGDDNGPTKVFPNANKLEVTQSGVWPKPGCGTKPAVATRPVQCPPNTTGGPWTQTQDFQCNETTHAWEPLPWMPETAPVGTCTPNQTGNGGLPAGSSVNGLFLGNSLTSTPPDFNNYDLGPLAVRLTPMLAEMGITLHSKTDILGGAEFSDHAANATSMADLADPQYDFANLQGYYHFYDTAAHFESAVMPLYTVANRAGTYSLFEGMWNYRGDGGSPQNPAAALAVEGAANDLANSDAVQVGRVWAAVIAANPSLDNPNNSPSIRYDNTHQNAVGEYINCLIYTRFLSGRSVANIQSISPQAAALTTPALRAMLKTIVDSQVTLFYTGGSGGTGGGGGTNQAPVANYTVTTSGLTATFTDTSHDPDGTIVLRHYGFGDGTTSEIANPQHTFPAAATYPVILTVTDNGTPPLSALHTQNVTVTANTGGGTLQPLKNQAQLTPVAKPAKNVPFTTQYNTQEIRVTDWRANEGGCAVAWGKRNYYSRRMPTNVNESKLMIYSACGGTYELYNIPANTFYKKLNGPGGDAEPQWDSTDPNKFTYFDSNGGTVLRNYNITTDVRGIEYDFKNDVAAALGTTDFDHCWTKDEGSPSADGRFVFYKCDKYNPSTGNFEPRGYVVLDLVNKRVVWKQTQIVSGLDSVSMSPSGRFVQFNANPVTTININTGASCTLNPLSEHSDMFIMANGHDGYVSIDFQRGKVFYMDIDTCTKTDMWDIYNNPLFGNNHYTWHFSGKAYGRPGFIVAQNEGYDTALGPLSTVGFDTVTNTAYGIGVSMANHNGYYNEVHTAVSRSGHSLYMPQNFMIVDDIDVYRINF